MSELLTVYEDYLKTEKHASANTVSSYVRDVHQFAQSMEDSGVSLTEVLPKDVEGFTKFLKGEVSRHGNPLCGVYQIFL